MASGGIGAPRGCQGALGPSGVSWVHWGLARSVGTQGPAGYRWHQGLIGGLGV